MWSTSHRLPAEVLSEIFFYFILHERNSTNKLARPEWLGSTGVCHYWRTVALANPRLWNQPNLRHPLMIQEMINCSQSLPLIIDVRITRWTTTQDRSTVTTVLHEYTSRIQHLHLYVSSEIRLSKVFPRPFPHPTPLLHTIELHNPGNIGFFTLPKDFLGGLAPALTHLTLVGCLIKPDSPLLRNLTFLHLDMRSAVLPINYHRTLGNAPRLKHMELYTRYILETLLSIICLLPQLHYFFLSRCHEQPL
ncbi:hypothetical protein PM082_006985 [Marasmius tenuissimus]|nr:hypothetical protein PM082_006985 [Marasmius tenuissimus]